MKHLKRLLGMLAACMLLTIPSAASAQGYIDFAAGKFKQSANVAGFTDQGNSTGFSVSLGTEYNSFLAMEFRYIHTGRANLAFSAAPLLPATMEADIGGPFLKLMLPFNENLRIYGIGGYSAATIKCSGGISGTSGNRQELSYGGGIEYVSGPWSAGAEWASYLRNVSTGTNISMSISGVTAKLSLRF